MNSSGKSGIKKGSTIDCPACGKSSVVKVINKMDGWDCVGQFFACAMCGHELGPVVADKEESPALDRRPAQREALAAFLGADEEEPAASVSGMLGDERGQFCKDCRHYYRNPFRSSCLRHEREVDPMGDCADFERRLVPSEDAGDE